MTSSSQHLANRRTAFSLVELLVVILILSILFALTAAAVVKATSKGYEVQARGDITQLASAIEAFKRHYNLSYVPSTLVLHNNMLKYDAPSASALEKESKSFLTTAWPQLARVQTIQSPRDSVSNPKKDHISWDGSNPVNVNASYTLKGHQVLVLLLGGAKDPNGKSRIGFSTSPVNPMGVTTDNTVRHDSRKTFFEFNPDRLETSRFGASAEFPCYLDVYRQAPYLYFGSLKSGNDYFETSQSTGPILGVLPYRMSQTQYASPNTFQIIYAGRDGMFGTGGLSWAGAAGASANGDDDMANFHGTLLGIRE